MKIRISLLVCVLIGLMANAQRKSKVLFTIDKAPVYTHEFIKAYTKNLDLMRENNQDDIEEYLELYINYKLKVKQAKALKVDTSNTFKREFKQYRESLATPYLKDTTITAELVREAHERMKQEVNVSHILVFVKDDATAQDTLNAFNKITDIRTMIRNGEAFEAVAKTQSEDPTAKENAGRLGYFTVFQMVYPFEDAAFKTAVGTVSEPFRTKFGYHILKVHDKRASKGEVEVAHIMIKDHVDSSKKKMDSLHKLIKDGKVTFSALAKKHSEDRASAIRGGKLNRFSYGRMVPEFADIAFALKEEGELSKPFKTAFGWHIVQLVKRYPVLDFEASKDLLTDKVTKDERSGLVNQVVINRLKSKYNIVTDKATLDLCMSEETTDNKALSNTLLSIDSMNVPGTAFMTYMHTVGTINKLQAYEKFIDEQVLSYYKAQLPFTEPDYAATLTEFKEGLMLFELLEEKVWNRSKDSVGLKSFFVKNKTAKYPDKELEEIKGVVISDYQNELEKAWIKSLRSAYLIEFNKSQKKKILQHKF